LLRIHLKLFLKPSRAKRKASDLRKNINTASKRFKIVSYKYLGKFAFDDDLKQLNIPESVADFIEGRTPKSVGARCYMLLKRKAIQFYPRYSEYVTHLRAEAFD